MVNSGAGPPMKAGSDFRLRLASGAEDRLAAQRLRYEVFVAELGSRGEGVDHSLRLETDRFDAVASHLMLEDHAVDGAPILAATTRLITQDQARRVGGFYSESEYDLERLTTSGRRVMELGRTCLRRDYRGGAAMFHLWHGLARHVLETETDLLFGVASFHGTDIAALAQPLSLLHYRHLAPTDLRPAARPPGAQRMNLLEEAELDRKAAMLATPALIKAYLRLGAMTGDGAFIDHDFNTTDVCLIVDLNLLSERQKAIYLKDLDA